MNNELELILSYFPQLTERQRKQISQLEALYKEWNSKINVISRKDIEHIYLHHVLHSLGIAKVLQLKPHQRVLDIGTGGGFPGIPLAILFPETQFVLIDSIGKKIRVVEAVATALQLNNVKAFHRNAKEEKGYYDYIVSRAVMNTSDLMNLIRKNINRKGPANSGLYCLKGGDLEEELQPFANRCKVWSLANFFEQDFFETKKIVYIKS